MADLTPQLRTRLSRVERLVGAFVLVATLLLIGGLSYYIFHTAKRKGWFLLRLPYYTYLDSAAGLNVGDPVKLLGFTAGQITGITAMPPFSGYNVFVSFDVQAPFYGYMWNDSLVRLTGGDVFGKRNLELVPGGTTGTTNLHATYDIVPEKIFFGRITRDTVTGIWNPDENKYFPFPPSTNSYGRSGYELKVDETEPLMAQLEATVQKVTAALPGVFDLTNQLAVVLSNTAAVTAQADRALGSLQPTFTNFAVISANLTNPVGSLGEWVLPTNLNASLNSTLTNANRAISSANVTVQSANTNLNTLAGTVNLSLENLANITSNLNTQVQANSNVLSGISSAVTNANVMLQGLRRHWFLRRAFKDVNAAEEAELEREEEARRQLQSTRPGAQGQTITRPQPTRPRRLPPPRAGKHRP